MHIYLYSYTYIYVYIYRSYIFMYMHRSPQPYLRASGRPWSPSCRVKLYQIIMLQIMFGRQTRRIRKHVGKSQSCDGRHTSGMYITMYKIKKNYWKETRSGCSSIESSEASLAQEWGKSEKPPTNPVSPSSGILQPTGPGWHTFKIHSFWSSNSKGLENCTTAHLINRALGLEA